MKSLFYNHYYHVLMYPVLNKFLKKHKKFAGRLMAIGLYFCNSNFYDSVADLNSFRINLSLIKIFRML